MQNFRNWDVYNNSKAFTANVYEFTEYFPESEKFGLTNQLRRATVSIVANIAEGADRNTEKDFKHFLSIATGSAFEVEALIEVSNDLDYINEEQSQELLTKLTVIQKQLNAFITKLNSKS